MAKARRCSTRNGKPFMQRYDPVWKELAPRDVVARAIHMEMLEHGYEHVYLDIASKRDAAYIRERFPQLIETCAPYGIDPTAEPIPVVPAAHYFCGGVLVDDWGRTDFAGLVRRRRSELHRAAWREPPRQHQPA